MADGRTIVFFPEGAYGPTNNCVGIGQVLRERGHRVVFIVEESFAGNLEAKGFEERLMRLGPAPGSPRSPASSGSTSSATPRPCSASRRSSSLGEFIAPTFQALIDGATYVQPRLEAIVDELQPDTIVEDNVVSFPAISDERRAMGPAHVLQPGRDQGLAPWRRSRRDTRRATVRRGRRSSRRCDRTHREMWTAFDAFCRERGLPALRVGRARARLHRREPVPQRLLLPGRGRLQARSEPLGPTWHQLDSTIRAADTTVAAPRRGSQAATAR